MVIFHTEHINEIGYYHQFANDMRVTNMLLVFSNNVRINQIEFKNKGRLRDTYSAFEDLIMLGLDPVSLCEWPGIDWDMSPALKMPLTLILISHFFVIFSTLVQSPPMLSNPYFCAFSLLKYCTLH